MVSIIAIGVIKEEIRILPHISSDQYLFDTDPGVLTEYDAMAGFEGTQLGELDSNAGGKV